MPDKKNILLISYYFPPLGMGGVKRPYALYKYLPESGYNVFVLTVKNICYPEYDFSRQASISGDLIFRAGSLDPARLMYLLGLRRQRLSGGKPGRRGRLFFPDSKKGWNRFALNKAKEIIKKKNISAIITTSPPPSTHLIALKLKADFNIPWIADFRDFWFSLPIEKVYSPENLISRANDLKKKVIDSADQIVSVSNSIKDYLGRGEVIMNGAEIDNLDLTGISNGGNNKFVIGVLGTINYLCPIEPLFKSIDGLFKENPSLKNKIEISHVGHIDSDSKHLIEKYRLNEIVRLRGYLPIKDAINVMLLSDLLYLSVTEFEKYHILPGRIFDYLVSGLPILGVVSANSDAAALLNAYEKGKVIIPGAINDMVHFLKTIVENRNNSETKIRFKGELNNKYSTRAMAEKYARLLDRILQ